MPHSRFSSICRAALFVGCLAALNVHSGDTIPFRARLSVTNVIFPNPTLSGRIEVRVGGSGDASDLGEVTCVTKNQFTDLASGRAVADYTLTTASGDQLVVHLDAQTIPDAISPQTKLTFSGGGHIVHGTGRLSGATGEVRNQGWSELQDLQTGQGIGYLEIQGEIPKTLATFAVTNTGDSGPGSLRQAILDANATPGTETIAFNIPGNPPHSIRPPKALPSISAPLFIDGTTQPGFVDRAIIELDGSTGASTTKASVGIRIYAGSSLVRGLAISRFGNEANWLNNAQILLQGRGSNVVERCLLGCNLEGLAEFTDGRERGFQDGIKVINSTGNLIGGLRPGAGNLISGNSAHGVTIESGQSNVVAGNLIGSDPSGTVGVPNVMFGVFLTSGTSRNVIGGEQAGSGNLISGNQEGVVISGSSQNRVVGNIIGPDGTGTASLKPGLSSRGSEVRQSFGVYIADGGTANEVSGNVLSANRSCGINLMGGSRNLIFDNRVGLDVSGTNALGNELAGICLDADPLASQPVTANVVSNNVVGANGFNGILLRYPGVQQNVIVGNIVGTDRGGRVDLGHSQFGVAILEGASQNIIGGPNAGDGNVIAFNDWAGVWVGTGNGTSPSTRNRIRGNSIFANDEQGIDLAPSHLSDRGVTPNDFRDTDNGPNTYQNSPVLALAETSGSVARLRGRLNSASDTLFDLDFYANGACGPAGHSQGHRYLGSTSVTTDAAGDVTFEAALSARVIAGEGITATATSTVAGNTSEFSACVTAVSGPSLPALQVTRKADGTVSLNWALGSDGFGLESTTSLSAPDWQAVPGVIGNSIELRADTQRFFRLHKP